MIQIKIKAPSSHIFITKSIIYKNKTPWIKKKKKLPYFNLSSRHYHFTWRKTTSAYQLYW